MTSNAEIAAQASALADQAAPGSLARRAAGCVCVAYATTKTPSHARRVLDDLDGELRDACRQLAEQLAAQAGQEATP